MLRKDVGYSLTEVWKEAPDLCRSSREADCSRRGWMKTPTDLAVPQPSADLATYRTAGIGDIQNETYKAFRYFKKSSHRISICLFLLLFVTKGAINDLELHLLSLSEKGY